MSSGAFSTSRCHPEVPLPRGMIISDFSVHKCTESGAATAMADRNYKDAEIIVAALAKEHGITVNKGNDDDGLR
jgi:hypothetical protein